MNDTSFSALSALAALAGSAVGALASVSTTWLTLKAQDRSHWLGQIVSRKETLYGQFIDEASKVLSDALTHPLEDASKLVHLYAILSKMRLFASPSVLAAADEVINRIIRTYETSDKNIHVVIAKPHDVDLLRPFSEACRRDMPL